MHIEDVRYHFEGTEMVGRLCYDDARRGRRPAVLLSHEAPGIDANVRQRAERLAALGHVAFALDCHGGGSVLPLDATMTRLAELMADPLLLRRIGGAGLDVLLHHRHTDPDRVAAIGFCMGGTVSLELARAGADLKAIVGFHPGIAASSRPADNVNIRASVLMCLGADDPFVPKEARDAWEKEMTDAGVDWTLELYGGVGHSFTNPSAGSSGMPGVAYDRRSDERSWAAMLHLFGETIGA